MEFLKFASTLVSENRSLPPQLGGQTRYARPMHNPRAAFELRELIGSIHHAVGRWKFLEMLLGLEVEAVDEFPVANECHVS